MAVDWAKAENLAARVEVQIRGLVDDIRLIRAGQIQGLVLETAQKTAVGLRLKDNYKAAQKTLADIKAEVEG